MLNTTLPSLRCPKRKRGKSLCKGSLDLTSKKTLKLEPATQTSAEVSGGIFETTSGYLKCQVCHSKYPILGGVALIVEDVHGYLLSHVKGIAQVVDDSEIPKEYLSDFLEAKAEIQVEHIEEDLEAERVNALYIMNHYLRVSNPSHEWWKSNAEEGSPLIDSLIRQYWDQGPFAQINRWMSEDTTKKDVIELGCGVGGLYPLIRSKIHSYLGVDSSFVSIAIGRHLALGLPYRGKIRFPGDLLQGSVSRKLNLPQVNSYDGTADFIVGDLDAPPLANAKWTHSIALNAIDMLDEPSSLPTLQNELLKKEGVAIQSCPYIWHPEVSKRLRKQLPVSLRDSSSRAVEWLYQEAGFRVEKSALHIPWLFFKHIRQLEIYSAHAFFARKRS